MKWKFEMKCWLPINTTRLKPFMKIASEQTLGKTCVGFYNEMKSCKTARMEIPQIRHIQGIGINKRADILEAWSFFPYSAQSPSDEYPPIFMVKSPFFFSSFSFFFFCLLFLLLPPAAPPAPPPPLLSLLPVVYLLNSQPGGCRCTTAVKYKGSERQIGHSWLGQSSANIASSVTDFYSEQLPPRCL